MKHDHSPPRAFSLLHLNRDLPGDTDLGLRELMEENARLKAVVIKLSKLLLKTVVEAAPPSAASPRRG